MCHTQNMAEDNFPKDAGQCGLPGIHMKEAYTSK